MILTPPHQQIRSNGEMGVNICVILAHFNTCLTVTSDLLAGGGGAESHTVTHYNDKKCFLA